MPFRPEASNSRWQSCSAARLASMGIAAAVLSVFVVLRRWAYMGEGISHAGFGGVGTALLLSITFPVLNNQAAIYCIASVFALATALTIAGCHSAVFLLYFAHHSSGWLLIAVGLPNAVGIVWLYSDLVGYN